MYLKQAQLGGKIRSTQWPCEIWYVIRRSCRCFGLLFLSPDFTDMTDCCQCVVRKSGVNHCRRLSESHSELLGYCGVLSGPIPIWDLNVYFATEARHVHPFCVRLG